MGLDTTGTDQNLLLNGGVFVRESIPARGAVISDLAVLTTQVMASVAVVLFAGDVITSIAFRSGATPAGTPTNWWFALYDDSATPALMAQTADQTTTAWGANTTMQVALATPQSIKRTAVYYAAVMVKATTPPSLLGQSLFDGTMSTGLVTGQKQLARTSGAALTATAPTTIASPTASLLRYYAALN
jgi:hypothetical protein